MKIHPPIFILGFFVILVPIIGLPQIYEQVILAVIGLAIVILVSSPKIISKAKNKKQIEADKNED